MQLFVTKRNIAFDCRTGMVKRSCVINQPSINQANLPGELLNCGSTLAVSPNQSGGILDVYLAVSIIDSGPCDPKTKGCKIRKDQ